MCVWFCLFCSFQKKEQKYEPQGLIFVCGFLCECLWVAWPPFILPQTVGDWSELPIFDITANVEALMVGGRVKSYACIF